MRLDKLLSECGVLTRTESSRAVRRGSVTVNGKPAQSPAMQVDPAKDNVFVCGERVMYRKFVYYLLNKPDGYVSATEDGREKTVLELLPADAARRGVFPCGRLDKHTTGLMFLTDDGAMGHDLLSPRHHVEKIYRFTVKFPLTAEEVVGLEAGAVLEDGYVTKPSRVVLDTDGKGGTISLIEGKYHQIKRMMESVHNQITSLERISFGPLTLDGAGLSRGEWRELTSDEVAALEALRGSGRARTEGHDREEKQEE